MNHCTNCLHWDEETADPEGHADCTNQGLRETFALQFKGYRLNQFMRPRGDDTCTLFTPKLAHPRSTP